MLLLWACKNQNTQRVNLISDFKAVTDSGLLQVVIEIPAGSDQKLIAALPESTFGAVHTMDDLKSLFPGVLDIIELWFSSCKDRSVLRSDGFGTLREADSLLGIAMKAYEIQPYLRPYYLIL